MKIHVISETPFVMKATGVHTAFLDHIELLNPYPKTKQHIRQLFNGYKSFDKSLAITVLGAYSVYFK